MDASYWRSGGLRMEADHEAVVTTTVLTTEAELEEELIIIVWRFPSHDVLGPTELLINNELG